MAYNEWRNKDGRPSGKALLHENTARRSLVGGLGRRRLALLLV